jgi:hypothetical protein
LILNDFEGKERYHFFDRYLPGISNVVFRFGN